jgi:CMP-N,N'-diacetyllegionaminic acid synthase
MAESRVLGILPARGGSKGIPGKNLKPLMGKPLIAWAATALANATQVERKICSTDDIGIAQVAESCGLEVPWLRPAELALDQTLVVDVIEHALRVLDSESGVPYTHVALIQATSPTVTAQDIDAAICLAFEKDADTIITGFHAGQRHPETMYTLDADGKVRWLLDQEQRMVRRQDLPPVFIRTGLVYVVKAAIVRDFRSIYGDKIVALTVEESRSVTIDEEADFHLAEFMMQKSNGKTNFRV